VTARATPRPRCDGRVQIRFSSATPGARSRNAPQPASASPSKASSSRPADGAYLPGSPASSASNPWKQRSTPNAAWYSRKRERAASRSAGAAAWRRTRFR
jgi:hypothetical protein